MSHYGMKFFQLLLFLLISNYFSIAFTADFVAEFGANFGSMDARDLPNVNDGHDPSYAGTGLSLMVGTRVDIFDDIHFRATVGRVKQFGIGLAYAWEHYPINVIAFKAFKRINIGAGITYHVSPSVTGLNEYQYQNREYENAFGFVYEVDYQMSRKLFFGIRQTLIDYKTKAGSPYQAGSITNGNSIALVFGLATE